MTQPKTLGELKRSGYKPLSVKAELRKNLIRKMLDREPLFPGIFGFEETVIPQVQNAILAGQDMIFLGERGQATGQRRRSPGQLTVGLIERVEVEGRCLGHHENLSAPDQRIRDGGRIPLRALPRSRQRQVTIRD